MVRTHKSIVAKGTRHGHPTGRLNLNAKAWRRLREVYADQPISSAVDLKSRFAGLWLSTLERVTNSLSKSPVQPFDLLFVIGHWRSGTTFLHELLCSDPQFNFPTTYACMNPQVFPLTEAAVLQRSAARTTVRPMDKMSVSLASPQEDEFALLALAAPSPYECLLFPCVLERSMAVADPEDLPESQKQEWIRIFTQFLAHVAARKPGRAVVLKSPTHSYRVRLLSRLFPNARFIHIVRNPIEVYQSTINMWTRLFLHYALTGLPDDNALTTQVIANWIRLEEKLDTAVPQLGAENYVRVTYEDLVAHPLKELESIYRKLKLKNFDAAVPHVQRYLDARAHFEKNRFKLAANQSHDIFNAWCPIFQKYGYPGPRVA